MRRDSIAADTSGWRLPGRRFLGFAERHRRAWLMVVTVGILLSLTSCATLKSVTYPFGPSTPSVSSATSGSSWWGIGQDSLKWPTLPAVRAWFLSPGKEASKPSSSESAELQSATLDETALKLAQSLRDDKGTGLAPCKIDADPYFVPNLQAISRLHKKHKQKSSQSDTVQEPRRLEMPTVPPSFVLPRVPGLHYGAARIE